jgi:hypothetical protein
MKFSVGTGVRPDLIFGVISFWPAIVTNSSLFAPPMVAGRGHFNSRKLSEASALLWMCFTWVR